MAVNPFSFRSHSPQPVASVLSCTLAGCRSLLTPLCLCDPVPHPLSKKILP